MFLLDNLLMAPGKAVYFMLQELAKKAQEDWLDDDSVKQELQEIYALLEGGKISEADFEAREFRLIERLQQIARAKLQAPGGRPGMSGLAAMALAAGPAQAGQYDVESFLDVRPLPVGDSVPVIESLPVIESVPVVETTPAVASAPLLASTPFAIAPIVNMPIVNKPIANGAFGIDSAPVAESPVVIESHVSMHAPIVVEPGVARPATSGLAPSSITADVIPPVSPAAPPVAASAPAGGPLTMAQVIESAMRGLSVLKLKVSAVTSVSRASDGWNVTAELVERKGVPDTSDLLGIYELRLDEAGNIVRYERTRMRRRCDLNR